MRLTFFSTLFFIFSSVWSYSQVINTIAGDGSLASGGDGGPATSAQLYRPWPIHVDTAGKVYTLETSKLRVVNSAGIVNTVAGTGVPGYSGTTGMATTVTVGNAFGIVSDKLGNIFLGQSSRVRKIDASGMITTVAGTGTNGYSGDGSAATAAQINLIHGIAIDDTGNLFIADKSNHRIRKVNTAGVITTIAGTGTAAFSGDGGSAVLAEINSPYGIATDHFGNVYFTDGSNKVRKVDVATGIINSIAGSGAVGYTGDGGVATLAEFRNLSGIAIDDLGNIFIGDAGNNVIRKINTAGVITTVVGTGAGAGAGTGPVLFSGDGGPATAAELHQPFAIDVDDTGNLYIADQVNNRLRKVSSGNHLPAFTGGKFQSLVICADSVTDISHLLTVSDPDMGQSLSWVLMNGPLHGVASVSYGSVSTGGTIIPTGLTYSPTSGFSGYDTVRVRIGDNISAGFTTIYITVNPRAEAGTISGNDTLCTGYSITLSNTVSGGIWSSSTSSVALVSTSGLVTGVAAGTAGISYMVTNSCGSDYAVKSIRVLSPSDCPVLVNTGNPTVGAFSIFPNPTSSNNIVLFLSDSNNGDVSVMVTNMLGQTVSEFRFRTNELFSLPINLDKGVYVVRAVLNETVYCRMLTVIVRN